MEPLTNKQIKEAIKKNGYIDVYPVVQKDNILYAIRLTGYNKELNTYYGIVVYAHNISQHKLLRWSNGWTADTDNWNECTDTLEYKQIIAVHSFW